MHLQAPPVSVVTDVAMLRHAGAVTLAYKQPKYEQRRSFSTVVTKSLQLPAVCVFIMQWDSSTVACDAMQCCLLTHTPKESLKRTCLPA